MHLLLFPNPWSIKLSQDSPGKNFDSNKMGRDFLYDVTFFFDFLSLFDPPCCVFLYGQEVR